MHHIERDDWLRTTKNDPRGYIQPERLSELWIHTGTSCNLGCGFCFEGSGPGDKRIEQISLEDIRPYVREALDLNVKRIAFTGGEPFMNSEIFSMLDFVLEKRPCLVLSNGTRPLNAKLTQLSELRNKPNSLKFRISLDYPNPVHHDKGRGNGSFGQAIIALKGLLDEGFGVSVARRVKQGENPDDVEASYRDLFNNAGLPEDIQIIPFPEFHAPSTLVEVPEITENCMTTYKTPETRAQFMCNFLKMIAKRHGRIGVYACTLVDDDSDYMLSDSLKESMKIRVMLKHHRCYACFASGCSCSES